MDPMFLSEVEKQGGGGGFAEMIKAVERAGGTVPQIFHLFAYKPGATEHLSRFTHEVMRGASPLSAGLRELIAAYTSHENHCPF